MKNTDKEILQRVKQMAMEQFDEDTKQSILAKMRVENAKDLSDSEIDRTLSGCVAPWLTKRAKMYRDCDFMNEADLKI